MSDYPNNERGLVVEFTKKKKIAFLMPDFGFIGAQKMCLTIVDALDKDKYEPYLIVQDDVGALSELDNLPTYFTLKSNSNGSVFSKLQTLFSPIKLSRIINQTKPDTIVSIAPWTNFVLLFSSYFFRGVKPFLIVEEHQHLSTSSRLDPDSHSSLMRFLNKYFMWMYNKADVVKCVSMASSQDFSEQWNVRPEKIVVLSPPINLNKLIELSNESLDLQIANFIAGADKIVLALGRLEHQKDFFLLIRSFKLVLKTNPNAKLVIIGDGKLKQELRKVVENYKLNQQILIAGFISNPYPVFKYATAFCLTSVWEGMPVVIIEAMALGCPVVAVDCPSGPKEMIQNDFNGKLVSRDSEEIAGAINYFLNNAEERQRSANEAFQSAKEWDISKYIVKFETLLNYESKS